jgi:hypothetical protein
LLELAGKSSEESMGLFAYMYSMYCSLPVGIDVYIDISPIAKELLLEFNI